MGSRGGGTSRVNRACERRSTLAQLDDGNGAARSGAALLTHSFISLSTFNKGYDPTHVLAFNLLFPDHLLHRTQGRRRSKRCLTRFRSNPVSAPPVSRDTDC